MKRFTRVFMAFPLLCMMSSLAMAEDGDPAQNNQIHKFTLFNSDPSNQSPTLNNSASANSQAPSPQSPSSLPRVSTVQPAPMSDHEKLTHYLRTTYGVGSIAYTAFTAGISQANGSVNEWGGGWEGYGKRYASSFGQKAVSRSIWQGMGYLMHEDPRYFRSNRSGIWNRTFYAATQSFISHKDSGGTRFGYSKLAGAFGGGAISRQWYPDRYHTTSDYFTAGGVSIAWNMTRNVFNEFWPDIRKWIHR